MSQFFYRHLPSRKIICDWYYKHILILNYNSNIANKFEASLTDDARVVIYNHHMFIEQTTGKNCGLLNVNNGNDLYG
jgi:hypothetical protein